MATTFQVGDADWKQYRELGSFIEVDFHPDRHPDSHGEHIPRWQWMEEVVPKVIEALEQAQREGTQYVIFTHGFSTSGVGQTTARSQVREAMRSSDAAPYIICKQCIEHYSVFVAAIRPLDSLSDDEAKRNFFLRVGPAFYASAGSRFNRRSLQMKLKRLLSKLGRTEMDYGSWIQERKEDPEDRPLRVVSRISEDKNSDDDVLVIGDEWLERLGVNL